MSAQQTLEMKVWLAVNSEDFESVDDCNESAGFWWGLWQIENQELIS